MNPIFSRRDFLSASASIGIGAVAGGSASAAPRVGLAKQESASTIPVIDTHQHLWDLNKLRLPWLHDPKTKHLQHNFLIKEYDEATAGIPIVKTVYMEVDCSPVDQEAEADFVINLCKSPVGRMRGAVIGGSLQSGDFGNYIKKYATNPYVKGVRIVLNGPDRHRGMCLERQFVENVRLLGELGLSFDLCMRPNELSDGVELADKCPQTRFIIDHCGNMEVQSTDAKLRASWEQGMKSAAAHPHFVCKISGVVATALTNEWRPADLESVLNFCLDTFGEDRVFFGSDWPVCTKRATLRQWYDALVWIVRDRSPQFRRKLFHDNAERFYKLS